MTRFANLLGLTAVAVACNAAEGTSLPDGRQSDATGSDLAQCGAFAVDGLYWPQGCACQSGEVCLAVDDSCVKPGRECGRRCAVGEWQVANLQIDGAPWGGTHSWLGVVTSASTGAMVVTTSKNEKVELKARLDFSAAITPGQHVQVVQCAHDAGGFMTWQAFSVSTDAGVLLAAATGAQYLPYGACKLGFLSAEMMADRCAVAFEAQTGGNGIRIPTPLRLTAGGAAVGELAAGESTVVLQSGVRYQVTLHQAYLMANQTCIDCGVGNVSMTVVKQ